jgi:hypothetical protein
MAVIHGAAFRFRFGAGAVAVLIASRSAGNVRVGTLPSSIQSLPDALALVPVNISRSTLPMSVKPCRMCGAMAACCSDVRMSFIPIPNSEKKNTRLLSLWTKDASLFCFWFQGYSFQSF